MRTYKVQESSPSGLFAVKGATTPCLPSAAPQHMLLDVSFWTAREGRKGYVVYENKGAWVGHPPQVLEILPRFRSPAPNPGCFPKRKMLFEVRIFRHT